jgi:thiol-disulfide isomerase/thioredoxin
MFRQTLLPILFSITLLLTGCSDKEGADDSMVASHDFTLTATDGTEYTVVKDGKRFIVEGMENKVVLFDIFATWCQPCQNAAKHLTHLQEKYADNVVVIGITIEEGIANTKLDAFKKEYGAEYIILNSEENRPLYRNIASAINVGGQFPIPLMVMYNRGTYVTHYMGLVAEEMIESDLQVALGQK